MNCKIESYKKGLPLSARQQQIANTMARVIALLSWTQWQYAEFKYKSGLKYLSGSFSPEVAAILERSRSFWNWWKMQWQLRDEIFVLDSSYIKNDHFCLLLYEALHDPVKLSAEITPNRVALGESYREMMETTNKDISKIVTL